MVVLGDPPAELLPGARADTLFGTVPFVLLQHADGRFAGGQDTAEPHRKLLPPRRIVVMPSRAIAARNPPFALRASTG